MNHWNLQSHYGLETLRVLGLLMLRRSKDMTIRATGQSIMEQRKLTVEVVGVPQSSSERALYCWTEYLVSQELKQKDDKSKGSKAPSSHALCIRLLNEICFSPVMINGGLGECDIAITTNLHRFGINGNSNLLMLRLIRRSVSASDPQQSRQEDTANGTYPAD